MNFLKLFNPGKQAKYVRNELRCFSGYAPSIRRVSATYGDATAESWLEIQLQDLSQFAGCKEKMTLSQFEGTSRAILLNYGYLKVTELMVFFQRFKAGHYGKFYGVVDWLVITSALHDFLSYRSAKIDEIRRMDEAERRTKVRESIEKECITFTEWAEKKKLQMKQAKRSGL
jgi:hypothetical protein